MNPIADQIANTGKYLTQDRPRQYIRNGNQLLIKYPFLYHPGVYKYTICNSQISIASSVRQKRRIHSLKQIIRSR